MGAILRYLREHPWQRRSVTILAALSLGALTGLLAYPAVRDHLLLGDLGSDDAGVRTAAVFRAAETARNSPRTIRRLERGLSTSSDAQFAAIVNVLRLLGRFRSPQRDPMVIDRMLAIELEAAQSSRDPASAAYTQRALLTELILSDRANRYVRRAMLTAAGFEVADLRRRACVLAARLGDDATLRALLADADAEVSAAAALAAGLGGRRAMVAVLAARLESATDPDVISACAYALALLGGEASSPRLCEMLAETGDELLRGRLLCVMVILNDDLARRSVATAIEAAVTAGRHPSAMELWAAGKLKVASAGAAVRAVLAAATDRRQSGELASAQLAAALSAADELAIPVRAEVNAICRRLWGPDWPVLMSAAARLLGRQAQMPQGERGEAPSRADVIETLRRAATYVSTEPPRRVGAADEIVTTPLASAASAVALWRIAPTVADAAVSGGENSSAFYVCRAARFAEPLPGDYIAWRLGRSGQPEALGLGRTQLGAGNKSTRATGAMLAALAARTPAEKLAAAGLIASRLQRNRSSGEKDFLLAGTYHCALVILGCDDHRNRVAGLLESGAFPLRRSITALCAAGDRRGLDQLLLNDKLSDGQVGFLLRYVGLGEVLAAAAPQLPRCEGYADDVLDWQVRILRVAYAIRRPGLRLELRQ